jgi:hypothetical protein
MKRSVFLLVALAALGGVNATTALRTGHANQEISSIFVTQIPAGYRDWRLVSVAHEEGNLNDIRAIFRQRQTTEEIKNRLPKTQHARRRTK